ncbi:MAG TPA: hypothetical protein VH144_03525 [Candidatus Saccharimonadales bacterium]|jgi:hypothetical protein|nr:hypothetical protein [Candidatus Saccharimonadales bacterium]
MTEQSDLNADHHQALLDIANTIYQEEYYQSDPETAVRLGIRNWEGERAKGSLTNLSIRLTRGIMQLTGEHYIKEALFTVEQKRRRSTHDSMSIKVFSDRSEPVKATPADHMGLILEPLEESENPYAGPFAGEIVSIFQHYLASRTQRVTGDKAAAA